jgi:hypothetical protein
VEEGLGEKGYMTIGFIYPLSIITKVKGVSIIITKCSCPSCSDCSYSDLAPLHESANTNYRPDFSSISPRNFPLPNILLEIFYWDEASSFG